MLLAAAALGACPRFEVGALPEAETAEPAVRVGLGVPGPRILIGGGTAVVVTVPDGGGLTVIPEGETATVAGDGAAVEARIGGVGTGSATSITFKPAADGGFVRVNGRDYRGEVLVTSTPTGVLAVNVVSLEAYVAGVVNAEMGRRPPADSQAVFAQAVVSRTVAVRALGRYRIRGYDLVSTVSDQAYGGASSETEMGWRAVQATRGEVLTYDGTVIEAFFHSTCGGRTEAVENVFSGAAQPYLVSVADQDAAGRAYCAISPRFRWREEWTGRALAAMLRDNAALAGLRAESVAEPSDLQIGARSPTGRVEELVLVAGGRAISIGRQQIVRQVLRGSDGGWLRSTQFSIQTTRSGGRIVSVAATGGGNGHGVGMCQWGAVGRAEAGFAYQAILSAYFPGTEIRRLY